MWQAILGAMSELGAGLAGGVGRAAASFGGSASRYGSLRALATAKKFATGSLARGALSGGKVGAASRLGLGAMVAGRRAKRGKKMSGLAMGLLSGDVVELGRAFSGLATSVRATSLAVAGQGGLGQFSAGLAQSQGQLEADRIRRAADFARGTTASESYNNAAQSRLEDSLTPIGKAFTNFKNLTEGAFKDVSAFGIKKVLPEAIKSIFPAAAPLLDLADAEEKAEKVAIEKEKARVAKLPEAERQRLAQASPQERDKGIRDDWWNSGIPLHQQALARSISEIARGRFQERGYERRRKPPLPKLDGGQQMKGTSLGR